MTQDEFAQAVDNGNVNVTQSPVPNEALTPQPMTDPIEDYLPVLNSIRTPRQHLTDPPTSVPKAFADQIQLFDDGTEQRAYFFINGAWRAAQLIDLSSVFRLLADVSLGSAEIILDTGSLAAKKYLSIQIHVPVRLCLKRGIMERFMRHPVFLPQKCCRI